jgi:hypothetical protein
VRRTTAIFLCLCAAAIAAPAAVCAVDVEFSGYALTDLRFTVQGEPSQFNYAEQWLNLAVKPIITDQVFLYGSVNIVANTIAQKSVSVTDQENRTITDPLWFELDQAYLSLASLGWKNLDVRIGKQRIAWGTADRFNPTDHLNPIDAHDPIDFGKKVPTVGILATAYAGPITLTGAVMPLYEPAVLPVTDLHGIFQAQFHQMAHTIKINTGSASLNQVVQAMMAPALASAQLGNLQVDSTLPPLTLSNMQAGFKLGGRAGVFDLSACYEYVLDDFGVPKDVLIGVPDPLNIHSLNVNVSQTFPRLQLIGGDMAASLPFLWDLGVWAEAAYFIPQRIQTTYEVDTGQFNEFLIQKGGHYGPAGGVVVGHDRPTDKPYFKITAGFDYTFPGAWYINAQYVRGLFDENTNSLVANYVFAGVDKPFFYETLKLRLFGGYCFDDHSWMLLPQATYVPYKNVELIVGSLLIFGNIGTKFGAFGNDIMFTKAKVSFK